MSTLSAVHGAPAASAGPGALHGLRVALYARVSTQRQAEAQNIELQLERLTAHAAAQQWGVAPEDVYRDDGYSGATLRRPGLDRLRDRAAGAHLDRIVITAPDRLARNFVHQALLVEELERHGAVVTFLERPMSQDPHDRLLLQIRGAVAEYERTLIVDRMRRGRLRRLQTGTLLPWTQAPYGYRLAPDRPRDPAGVRLDAVEAAVVRDIFAWVLDEGLAITAVVQRLHRLGIPSPKGRAYWSPSSVRRVLTNPAYAGHACTSRTRSCPATSRRSALAPVGRRPNSERHTAPEDWIPVARVPAIVDQAQLDVARARLEENRRLARRNAAPGRYLLRGLVSCGHCRRGCDGLRRQRPGGPAYEYYVCRTRSHGRVLVAGARCGARNIPARQLEALVWADLCALLRHPTMIADAMARARGGHWVPQELAARRAGLRRGRASLSQQRERLTEAYLAGALELAEYRHRRADLEGRQAVLRRQEEQLASDAVERDGVARLAAQAGDFCRRVAEGLEHLDAARQRELLELLIDRVVVTDDLVEIRYVVPTTPAGERQRFCLLRLDYLAPRPPDVRLLGTRAVVAQPHRRPYQREESRAGRRARGARRARRRVELGCGRYGNRLRELLGVPRPVRRAWGSWVHARPCWRLLARPAPRRRRPGPNRGAIEHEPAPRGRPVTRITPAAKRESLGRTVRLRERPQGQGLPTRLGRPRRAGWEPPTATWKSGVFGCHLDHRLPELARSITRRADAFAVLGVTPQRRRRARNRRCMQPSLRVIPARISPRSRGRRDVASRRAVPAAMAPGT
jgi:site-specific DNA recombinase